MVLSIIQRLYRRRNVVACLRLPTIQQPGGMSWRSALSGMQVSFSADHDNYLELFALDLHPLSFLSSL